MRKIMMDPLPLDTVLKGLQVDTFAPNFFPLTVESVSVESQNTYGNPNDVFEFGRLLNELRIPGVIKINIQGEQEDSSTVEKKTAIGDAKDKEGATTTTRTVKHNIPKYCLILDKNKESVNLR